MSANGCSLENGEQNGEIQRRGKTLLQKLHIKPYPDDVKQIKLEADRARTQLDKIRQIIRDEADRLCSQKGSQLHNYIDLQSDPIQMVQVLIDEYRKSLEEKEKVYNMNQTLDREKSDLQRQSEENESKVRETYE